MTLEAVDNYRILLVEDDDITNYLNSMVLQQNGIQHISVAENGMQAISYLKDGNIADLIFLDLNMPILDGLGFLEKIKLLNIGQNIPVVILSSSILKNDISQSTKYTNVLKYMEKPLDDEKVTQLFSILDRQK